MLTIANLETDRTLDTAAMRGVRGGLALAGDVFGSFFGIANAPTIDLGTHLLGQEQNVAVDQSNAIGGFNLVGSHQTQSGVSGQVSLF